MTPFVRTKRLVGKLNEYGVVPNYLYIGKYISSIEAK
jgi:hypothetical protein